MPRLSNQQYLQRHHVLRELWLNNQPQFARVGVSQQWELHAYFLPSKDLTDKELLEHRQAITKEDRSLPHKAGKAFAALRSPRKPRSRSDMQSHQLGVYAVAKPELDMHQLTEALLALVREIKQNGRGSSMSLIADLATDRIPQIDLGILLQWQFPRGQMDPKDPLTVVYSTDQGEALRIIYNKDGDIINLVALEHWSDELFKKLKTEIDREAAGTINKVRRAWAFASVKTEGSWRYRDRFQICQPPEQAPVPGQLFGDHPFLLEVSYAGSDHGILNTDRSTAAVRRTELLLNVVLRYGIHQLSNSARKVWVLTTPQLDPLVFGTEFRQIGYTADGLEALPEGFSDPRAALAVVDHDEYFDPRAMTATDTLSIPDNLEALLDAFFGLTAPEQNRFLRACYWFQFADQVWDLSKSSSFTALIQTVETLQPEPETTGHCPTCNRTIGPGPTTQFINFVDAHAPGIPKAIRQHLYRLRSNLSHGNALLRNDEYAGFGSRFTPAQQAEWQDASTARHVARVVLLNWLLGHGQIDDDGAVAR